MHRVNFEKQLGDLVVPLWQYAALDRPLTLWDEPGSLASHRWLGDERTFQADALSSQVTAYGPVADLLGSSVVTVLVRRGMLDGWSDGDSLVASFSFNPVDHWEAEIGGQLQEFLERATRDSQYVLIVCTLNYKARTEERLVGEGHEGHIITGEMKTLRNHLKFIPVLRSDTLKDAAPSWLMRKVYCDLSDDPFSEENYQKLVRTLRGSSRIRTTRSSLTPAAATLVPIGKGLKILVGVLP